MAKSKLGKKMTKAIDAVEKFVDGLRQLQQKGEAVAKALSDLKEADKEESGE